MAYLTTVDQLNPEAQAGIKLVLATLDHAVNVVTRTRIAATAITNDGLYAGGALTLSGTTRIHAEQAALAAAASTGDRDVHTLCVAMRRYDGRDPGLVMPCGACRQLITDYVTFTGRPISVLSVNEHADTVKITGWDELLPDAFSSVTLQNAASRTT